MPAQVLHQTDGRGVTARPVFLQRPHDDPVHVPAHGVKQFRRRDAPATGHGGELVRSEADQPGGRSQRLLFTDDAPHPVQPGHGEFFGSERKLAGEQFVQQHAERINIATRVNVHRAKLRLLGTHIGGRADELLKRGVKGLVTQPLLAGGLGDAEVNDLGRGRVRRAGHEDVGRFDVPMDDALLVRVLDGFANVHKQLQPLACGKIFLIAIAGDRHAIHKFHHEKRTTLIRRPGVRTLAMPG